MNVEDNVLLRLETDDDHNVEETLHDIQRSESFSGSIVAEVTARIDDMLQVWPEHGYECDSDTKHFLVRGYYDAIHAARNFPKRHLGFFAAKHFHDTLLVGLAVGVSDLDTHLTLLWHDYIEDSITAERKRRLEKDLQPLSENNLLSIFSRSMYNTIRIGLCEGGMDKKEAKQRAERVTHNVREYMTRRDEQFYYAYLGHLFRPVALPRQKRCAVVIAKYCDRYANDNTLQKGTLFSPRNIITYDDIASIFPEPDADGKIRMPDREALNTLRQRFNKLSYTPFPSSMLDPGKWISSVYKSAVLDTVYRSWTEEKPERCIPEVERIPLAALDQRQMYNLFTYVVSFMGPSVRDLCFIDDVVLLHKAVMKYEQKGGFQRVTAPTTMHLTDYDYDGFISTFLDTKVRGKEENIKSLVEDPFLLAKATIALHHWRRKFAEDREYTFAGLTEEGITLAPPAADSLRINP